MSYEISSPWRGEGRWCDEKEHHASDERAQRSEHGQADERSKEGWGWFFSVALLLFCVSASHADLLMDMEGGNFEQQQNLEKEAAAAGNQELADYYRALGEFYRGNLGMAHAIMSQVSSGTAPSIDWLKEYLSANFPILAGMESSESEHFILKTRKEDKFLAGYALEALEKAYVRIGGELEIFPKEKITAVVYPTQESFTSGSTLSKEIMERSGAIAVCKFRKLMILSPEQLAFGYRWLDTLSHEYTHFLINAASAGKCPLWMHEGISKYLETRWRLDEPDYLTPGNRTELVRALKDDKLVSFSRMEPSMVYLKDQAEVRLAFSEVAHAVGAIRKMKGPESLRLILKELAQGKSRQDAFQSVLNLSDSQFESKWREILKGENLQESPGSAPDVLEFEIDKDEMDEFVGTDLQGHIRLGDRMRKNGQLQAALIQYDKALEQEANNPVALVKMARTLISLGTKEEALTKLDKCIKENPNYVPGYIVMGELLVESADWGKAAWCYTEANAINPFNPEVHKRLSEIYVVLGDIKKSQEELDILDTLTRR